MGLGRNDTELKKEAFLRAMVKTFGNISASCKVAGIKARSTVYVWAKNDPEFKERLESDDYDEIFMDAVEAKLAKLGLIEENPTVLIFLAKTKCKKRGYVESSETKHSGIPNPINIIVSSKENAEMLEKFLNNNEPSPN